MLRAPSLSFPQTHTWSDRCRSASSGRNRLQHKLRLGNRRRVRAANTAATALSSPPDGGSAAPARVRPASPQTSFASSLAESIRAINRHRASALAVWHIQPLDTPPSRTAHRRHPSSSPSPRGVPPWLTPSADVAARFNAPCLTRHHARAFLRIHQLPQRLYALHRPVRRGLVSNPSAASASTLPGITMSAKFPRHVRLLHVAEQMQLHRRVHGSSAIARIPRPQPAKGRHGHPSPARKSPAAACATRSRCTTGCVRQRICPPSSITCAFRSAPCRASTDSRPALPPPSSLRATLPLGLGIHRERIRRSPPSGSLPSLASFSLVLEVRSRQTPAPVATPASVRSANSSR